jgi:hypothetical protein
MPEDALSGASEGDGFAVGGVEDFSADRRTTPAAANAG